MSKKNAVARRGVPKELGSIFGLVAMAAFPAMVVPALAQQESQDFRYMTVLQRPRDNFDPKGIPVGGFRFLPSVEVAESYTDNLYAVHDGTTSDFETTISPKLLLKSDWSRHSMSVSGYGNIHRFADHTTEDTEEYGAEGNLGLELGGGGTFDLTGGYDHETVARTDPEERRRLTPEEVGVTHAKAQWKQEFSFLLLGASAQLNKYEEDLSADRDKNRVETTGAFRVGYVFSPALSVFAEPFYTKRDFDFVIGGLNRDSEVKGINAGVGYDITGTLYGETKIGWYRAGFTDPNTRANSGLSIESKTTWNVTPRNTFIVTLARQNAITNVLDTSSRVITGGEIQYQHELRRNILLRAQFSYYTDEFVGSVPHREDDEMKAVVRGDYLLNRYLSFYALYQRNQTDSTLDAETFAENVFMIGIRGQF